MIQDPKQQRAARNKYEDRWSELLQQAKKVNPDFRAPDIPYHESHVVGQFNGLDNGNCVIMD